MACSIEKLKADCSNPYLLHEMYVQRRVDQIDRCYQSKCLYEFKNILEEIHKEQGIINLEWVAPAYRDLFDRFFETLPALTGMKYEEALNRTTDINESNSARPNGLGRFGYNVRGN